MIPVLAVSLGAAMGACLRWSLGLALNPLFPTVPLGTLCANWLGGYLIGVALAFFDHNAALPPEWRLLVITGFMGSLTTFSTFSAEVVTMLGRGQYGWAVGTAAVHLLGSLALTAAGFATVSLLVARG